MQFFLRVSICALATYLVGCAAPKKIEVVESGLVPSWNFHQNIDPAGGRAKFGLNTADCVRIDGQRGVFVVALSPDSVLAVSRGLRKGDRIIQLGAHKIASTVELTYVIKRITPDTVQTVVYERSGRVGQVFVIPPRWVPSKGEATRIDLPYPKSRNPCGEIGLRNIGVP